MEYRLIQSILDEDRPELSIILPSIRVDRLPKVYESIQKSTNRTFELVIVGPYDVPEELRDKKNVKYARDWGSPMRASNIGAQLCEGKVITWNSDDTLFLPGAIDAALDLLYSMGDSEKNVVVAKYYEGKNYSGTDAHGDDYYKLCNAYPRSPHIPVDWWIFNSAFVYRSYFEKLGGWDCRYQACPLGHADFAVRAQRDGAVVKMLPTVLATSDHLGPGEGDHVPIEIVQSAEDSPLYINHYSAPLDSHPICIDVSNWKKAPHIWRKRF